MAVFKHKTVVLGQDNGTYPCLDSGRQRVNGLVDVKRTIIVDFVDRDIIFAFYLILAVFVGDFQFDGSIKFVKVNSVHIHIDRLLLVQELRLDASFQVIVNIDFQVADSLFGNR